MLTALISFELKRRLKMLSSWVYALIFFAGSLLLMLAAGGVFKGMSTNSGGEKVMANSPFMLFTNIGTMSLFGVLAVAAIFGQAAHQDFAHRTWQIIFTKNVPKGRYLLGRFLGAWVFSSALMLSIGVGMLFGTGIVALVDDKQLTTFNLLAYVWPFIVQVWPMLFTCGALFFALAALTRRMAPVYVGMVVLVMGYLIISAALGDVQNKTVGALADPFGFFAFDVVTRYWSPAERNSDLIGLTGLFLANRVIWASVGVGLLALTIARFRPMVEELKGSGKHDEESAPTIALAQVTTPATPTTGSWARTMFSTAWLSFLDVVRSPVYLAFLSAGLASVLLVVALSNQIFGTSTLPVTYQVLEMAAGSFRLFSMITITFYAGEIVWRERDAGVDDIVSASRVPTWVGYGSKLLALLLVAASLQAVVGGAALIWQLAKGYTAIEFDQYAINLTVFGFLRNVPLCALALVLQVVINQKYVAHFAMVLYFVWNIALTMIGVEDRLVMYGAEPSVQFSDMNRYGQKLEAIVWFRAYWWAWALVLLVIGGLLAVRGRETSRAMRLHEARRRFTSPVGGLLALAIAVIVGTGGYLYYQTHLFNPYLTSKDQERGQAAYEKAYKAEYASKPQPRITGLEVNVDIYPEQLRVDARGTYRVKNKSSEPITKVLVNLADRLEPKVLTLAGEKEKSSDLKLGTHLFELSRPLAPGDEADLVFDLTFDSPGISHEGAPKQIVANGTFINNGWFPVVGYVENGELDEDNDRKKYDLPPKERMRDRDDPVGLANNYIRQDSDFITFKATVSTSGDQLPVAPGTVTREWSENGRNFASFEMDQPILNFVAFLSARYARKQDEWNGVKLEIDYHPAHTANLDRMMNGLKDSLAYCSEQFGPYQHHQARIIEFPRYAQFAQSFPNTIPYSEAIGFIAQVREGEPDDIDYPYYITAHEIAHQWFAHQVVGGNTQGATVTSETLSQYAALMVMKHKYGEAKMRRFLKYELDGYLMGRAMERKKELPLGRVENQQYIHYKKGSLVMYALQDLIGEDVVNGALKKYVAKVRFQSAPYTNATELISYLRAATPPDQQSMIDDFFEKIVIYDNRAVSATMRSVHGGAYEVTLKVKSTKLEADQEGIQKEVESNDLMIVGAVDEKGDALLLEKRRIPKGESAVTFIVPSKPARVGIDPLNELVDKTPDDNLTDPTIEDE